MSVARLTALANATRHTVQSLTSDPKPRELTPGRLPTEQVGIATPFDDLGYDSERLT